MTYGEQCRDEMKSRESQLRNFFGNVDVALRKAGGGCTASGPQKWMEEEQTLSAALTLAGKTVHERLLDSIDTRGAMDALAELIKSVNLYLISRQDGNGPPVQAFLLRQAAAFVTRILSVFGLAPSAGDVLGMGTEGGAGEGADSKTAAVLDAFCSFRDSIRSAARAAAPHKEFLAACDAVRDTSMVELGIRLEDNADGGSVWKSDDAAVLRAERDEKLAVIAAAATKKLRSKIDAVQRDVEKYEKLSALPSPQDALKEKYSKFDETTGEPTHDVAGVALEGKALEKAKKELEKQKKMRLPLEKKKAEDGIDFLETLRKDVAVLEAQLAGMEMNRG